MRLFGNGRAAIADDAATAELLRWPQRRRSTPAPERVLRAREGDPRREPWVAPPWWRPGLGGRPARRGEWTYLPGAPGVVRYLERLAQAPSPAGVTVALAGLGRVGGVAATLLAATPCRFSGIRELLVYDVDAGNLQRWLYELSSIARWRGEGGLPRVRQTSITQVFFDCDVFLFAATAGVPPLGSEGDVRLAQFAPNRALLHGYLERARAAGFAGLFLVVSDPVDWLAQAAFVGSNRDGAGRFAGDGLAPERVAGLGLGVMWGRALAAARREGWEAIVARRGGAFGPHGEDVLVFDDLKAPNLERSGCLTQAAREGNMAIRHLGFLPFVGPGASSVALALPPLLAGEPILASVLVSGIYFGCEARLDWGLYPAPQRLAPVVSEAVAALQLQQRARARSLGLLPE